MEREIKFQAVNDEGKIIVPDYIDRHGIAWWKENSIPACTRRIRQYAGFKDKTEKEIYEGDIIRYEDALWIVEWSYDRWDMMRGEQGVRDDDMRDDPGYTLWEDSEVIGNIYENPGLIG